MDNIKIYLSYSHCNKELATKFKEFLTDKGFDILWDENLLIIGQDFNQKLKKALYESNIFLPIISDEYQNSRYAQSEFHTAIGYCTSNQHPIIFPYITHGTEIPIDISNRLCVIGTEDIDADMEKIVHELDKTRGLILSQQNEREALTAIVHGSLDDFLTDVFTKLEKEEKNNKFRAYLCYILSVVFLILVVPIAYKINITSPNGQNIIYTILYFVKSIAILSVLAALSRLTFILGKSFMVESIRNGDRIHAISFGRFYIRAYGHEATRQEIKEVLGDWNIDKGSSFHSQDAKEIDPNFYGALELLKSYFNKE